MRLIVLCTAALAGVVLGDVLTLPPGPLALAALLALCGVVCGWRKPARRWLALLACALALGCWRASIEPPAAPQTTQHSARALPSSGLAGQLASVRSNAEDGIRRYLPEPQASLAVGVLLGGSGSLDAEFRLQLQRSGLSHVVAIDGFKQVVVASAIGAPSIWLLGRYLASLPIMVGLVGYTLLTGAHPSAVRAGLMVGLATMAALVGRVPDPLTSLFAAVVVMATFEPRILLDVGLQLSVSAVLGIVLLWPRLRPRPGWSAPACAEDTFRAATRSTYRASLRQAFARSSARAGFWRALGDRTAGLQLLPRWVVQSRWVLEPAGLTLAVSLATLPVVLSVFQLVSLVSPVAHVLAIPLLPLVLGSTALLALAAPFEPLAQLVSPLAWLPTTLLVQVVQFSGRLPGAAVSTGHLPTLAAAGLAGALLAWGLWNLPEAAGLRRRWLDSRPGRASAAWSAPALWMLACLSAAGMLEVLKPDGRLHVQALAAGRGEAVLIRAPTGQTTLLVGGSPNASLLASQVAVHLPVWEHRLDSVLLLDTAAEPKLALTLARYPADRLLHAHDTTSLDLGGGATLGIAAAATAQTVSFTFGAVRLPLPDASNSTPIELVSDGVATWYGAAAK